MKIMRLVSTIAAFTVGVTLFAAPAEAAGPVRTAATQSCAGVVIKPGNGTKNANCVRLIQAKLGVSQVGNYGPQTQKAVYNFQKSNGLAADKIVGPKTWAALGVSGSVNNTSSIPSACRPYAKVNKNMACVNMTAGTATLYVNGKATHTESARFGMPGYDTTKGAFTIYLKKADYWSTDFNAAMPYTLMYHRGQALHYSSDFAAGRNTKVIGGIRTGSHGCVNLLTKDGAKKFYDNLGVGDVVVVF